MTSPDPVLLADRQMANANTLAKTRTACSLIAGVGAGVLGLTGMVGFAFYIAQAVLASMLVLSISCGNTPAPYFAKGRSELFSVSGLLSGLTTFVLVWTVVYDCLYIF